MKNSSLLKQAQLCVLKDTTLSSEQKLGVIKVLQEKEHLETVYEEYLEREQAKKEGAENAEN